MGPKFNQFAYGKPPPRSSRRPEIVVEGKNPITDRSTGHTKQQQDPVSKNLYATDVDGVQNDAVAKNLLKEDTLKPEGFVVVPESTGTEKTPTDDDHIIDTTNLPVTLTPSVKAPPLSTQETTSVPVNQLEKPDSPSPPSEEKLCDSSLPVEDIAALEIHTQEPVTSVKAVRAVWAKHFLNTRADNSRNLKPQTFQSNSNVRVVSKMEKPNQDIARSDRLKQLQDASLRQITRKTAARKHKDTNNTVSIRDLDLARAPVNTKEPGSSIRTWAKDSPIYDGDYEKALQTPFQLQKDLSVVTQVPSTSHSNIRTTATTRPAPTETRRSKWAVKDEMKAEKAETNSNEWGSAAPSDATRSSNVSDESLGKLLRNREPAAEEPLQDWEGNFMPPPADWAERPRYNNNNRDFKVQFRKYIRELQERFSNGVPIKSVPAALLQNECNHPDGIGMIHRAQTIDINNAARYGYTENAVKDALTDAFKDVGARPIRENDYEVICLLDMDDETNAQFDREETTKDLVENWNKHIANARGESIKVVAVPSKPIPSSNQIELSKTKPAPIEDLVSADEEEEEAVPLAQPVLNIYLRPATRADLSELTRIYNWYVANSSQPAELREIDESAMQSRMSFCESSKLPFIVAACKSQKGARPIPHLDDEELSRRCRLPVTHKQHITLTRIEDLAGFCCANDFTQPDFVEHIAADIEIYVDAQHRRQGVGKCLMDKILEICDRSHRLTMDVPFHCDREVRHVYGPGGIRDIHKMSVLLRKWHAPKAATISVNGKRKPKKLAFVKAQENDYAQWLKRWFQSLGFEEEGFLSKMGAKNGRYIDLVYFGRETSWQPTEGKVPDPAPEFMDATFTDEDEDQ